jgi:hypothetical protein
MSHVIQKNKKYESHAPYKRARCGSSSQRQLAMPLIKGQLARFHLYSGAGTSYIGYIISLSIYQLIRYV